MNKRFPIQFHIVLPTKGLQPSVKRTNSKRLHKSGNQKQPKKKLSIRLAQVSSLLLLVIDSACFIVKHNILLHQVLGAFYALHYVLMAVTPNFIFGKF